MKKFYTAIALILATATSWAQNHAETLQQANGNAFSLNSQTETARLFTANAKAPVKATSLPDKSQIISEQPEGTLYADMYRECNGFNDGYDKAFHAYAGDIVVSKDNKKLYIKNFCPTFNTGWIVGDIKENGIVEFNFPQVVYHQTQDANGQAYELTEYAWKMIADKVNYKINLDMNSQTVKFRWDGSTLTQVDPNDIIALAAAAGQFAGYGSYNNEFSVITDTKAVPAEGLKNEVYTMTYTDYLTQQEAKKNVRVAMDGNDVYIGGFYNDGWIKGTKKDDKIYFPSYQYLGTETIINKVHKYFIVFEINANRTEATMIDELVLDYDEATGDISTTTQSFGVNQGKYDQGLLDIFELPSFKNANYVVEKPAKPRIYDVMPFDAQEEVGALAYYYSNMSVSGKEMDENSIFYNIYLDGKLMKFDKTTYAYLPVNEIVDVPYAFFDIDWTQSTGMKGYDFAIMNGMQFIYFYKKFSQVAVKAIYDDGITKLESDMATYGELDGINNATVSEAEGEATFYDLSGRKVSSPEKGVYIKAIQTKDGNMKTVKVMK